jgi:hypothetical protein
MEARPQPEYRVAKPPDAAALVQVTLAAFELVECRRPVILNT